MTTRYRTMDSPLGPLTLAGVGDTLQHVRMTEQSHPPKDQEQWRHDTHCFADAAEQLGDYFAGRRQEFDLNMEALGTPFQMAVWRGLLAIPYGQTRSYGALAAQIGRSGSARAVGLANGRNPLGIIIPCHRVIGASGSLVGYGGGTSRKKFLLDLEARVSQATAQRTTSAVVV